MILVLWSFELAYRHSQDRETWDRHMKQAAKHLRFNLFLGCLCMVFATATMCTHPGIALEALVRACCRDMQTTERGIGGHQCPLKKWNRAFGHIMLQLEGFLRGWLPDDQAPKLSKVTCFCRTCMSLPSIQIPSCLCMSRYSKPLGDRGKIRGDPHGAGATRLRRRR